MQSNTMTIVFCIGIAPQCVISFTLGLFFTGGVSIGDTAIYSCTPGFEVLGNSESTCTLNGDSALYLPAINCLRKLMECLEVHHSLEIFHLYQKQSLPMK